MQAHSHNPKCKLLQIILFLMLFGVLTAQAQDARVNTDGLRLRAGPSTDYPILDELPLDTPLTLLERNEDGTWLLVRLDDERVGWVFAEYVDPIAASAINEIPVVAGNTTLIFGQYLDDETVANVRETFARGQQLGNHPDTFSKVGDSITVAQHVLHPIGYGIYELGDFTHLESVIDHFAQVDVRDNEFNDNSFNATSYAAGVGWNTAVLLDPEYADPDACEESESPLECEYRITQPAIALIMIGTNDVGLISNAIYRSNLRIIIDKTLDRGIIPILSTIPNQPAEAEGVLQVNAIIREVAREFAVPLWDYGLVMSALPDEGLNTDGIHPSIPPGGVNGSTDFRADNLYYGYVLRNLTALVMLNAVWRAVNT
jgi:uncharacterized protein YraI